MAKASWKDCSMSGDQTPSASFAMSAGDLSFISSEFSPMLNLLREVSVDLQLVSAQCLVSSWTWVDTLLPAHTQTSLCLLDRSFRKHNFRKMRKIRTIQDLNEQFGGEILEQTKSKCSHFLPQTPAKIIHWNKSTCQQRK